MEIGNKILELRKKNNITQEELAEKMNVARQTISKWELGETSPDLKQAASLSKIFNVSLDELVNNDVKNVIVEKVSNTEKLAGIIIKILKFIGIAFLVMLIVDITALIFFTFIREDMITEQTVEITMTCHKQENDYLITVGSDGYFNCSNCSESIQKELKAIVDYKDISHNEEIITEYFEDKSGTCE